MIAPILAYTSDEIWKYMPHSGDDKADHVIFNDMPEKVDVLPDEKFMSFWDEIHALRDDVKKTIEPLVKEKKIKGSLESKITLSAGKSKLDFLKKARLELKEAFIVSELEVKDNGAELEISVEKAEGEKCERCWSISKTVGQNSEHPTLCARCCENLK